MEPTIATNTTVEPIEPTTLQSFLVRFRLGTMQPDGLVELGTVGTAIFASFSGIALFTAIFGAMWIGQLLGDVAASLAGRGWRWIEARIEARRTAGEAVAS